MLNIAHLVTLGLSVGLSYAVRVSQPPVALYNASLNAITGSVTFGPSNLETGPGVATSFIVQYKDFTQNPLSGNWLDVTPAQPYLGSNVAYTFNFFISVSNIGDTYVVRAILLNQNARYDGDDVPFATVNTGNGGNTTPNPNQKTLRLTQAPAAQYNAGQGTITGTVTFGPSNPVIGQGVPASHVVQYKDLTQQNSGWLDVTAPQPYLGNIQAFLFPFTINNISPGKTYGVRDILLDQQGTRYGGDDVPFTTVITGVGGVNTTPNPNGKTLRLTQAPTAQYNAGLGTITGTVTFGPSNPVIGQGVPTSHVVQYKDLTQQNSGWLDVTAPQPYLANILPILPVPFPFTINNVIPGRSYGVRDILLDQQGTRYGGDDVPFTTVNTGGGNTTPRSNTTPSPLGNNCMRLTFPPTAQGLGFGTINVSVTLGPNNPVQGQGSPTFFVFQYRDRTNSGSWTDWGLLQLYPTNLQVNQQRSTLITGLRSGVVYEVRVVLINAAGQRCTVSTVPLSRVGTQCNLPQDTVDTSTVTSSLDTSQSTLTVNWSFNPTTDSQSCQLLGFQVMYTYNQVTSLDSVKGPTIVFSRYTQGLPITLRIRPMWSGGYGVFSQFVTVAQNNGK